MQPSNTLCEAAATFRLDQNCLYTYPVYNRRYSSIPCLLSRLFWFTSDTWEICLVFCKQIPDQFLFTKYKANPPCNKNQNNRDNTHVYTRPSYHEKLLLEMFCVGSTDSVKVLIAFKFIHQNLHVISTQRIGVVILFYRDNTVYNKCICLNH